MIEDQIKKEANKAAEVIKKGGVILYPTDTVWGLGCDPKNDSAIEKILDIKNRPEGKSMIMLVPDQRLLQRYVKDIPEVCFDLIDYSVKPLTIVYPNGQYVSDKVMAEDGSLAIRLTKDPFCTSLMNTLKSGITSTSANLSGQVTPTLFSDITLEILGAVDYVVDLPDYKGSLTPSQIIKVKENGEFQIIRK
ncbi:threonylcarbamoyl-AMP synthase [Paracrocinitomix mangrovi]|uniref:L-threonylcarbamoyladenylate synthase n=1 Tax=Paracrocinitomix mangrovi TaxID=2862509 RepID=UPI001EDC2BC8|nr:L-threonylcarbamoyladenylate synthase [Paracrocinitomix mangrovi]UKN03099.1 threonylcarbamoyl-AMP synthase [Paracrocinitomix mangrovi]